MTRDERRLKDIVECCDELAGYIEPLDVEEFLADRLVQRATERLLTIIGEAAKSLSSATRDAIDEPWREIIRFRDKGIHSYDSLTAGTLYRIATESLPSLRRSVAEHLARGGGAAKES